MDKFFEPGAEVHAIDSITGVWRNAKVVEISPRTVKLHFYKFNSKKFGLADLTLPSALSSKASKAHWPIRRPVEGEMSREQRRALSQITVWSYKPENCICYDTVYYRDDKDDIQ